MREAARPEIGLKYCGGCHAGYDRAKALETIRNQFPQADFVNARPEKHYGLILVLCGCTAACADVSALQGQALWLTELTGLDVVSRQIADYLCKKQTIGR